ncbi:hydroxyacid dehydrogenase [Paenibacillus plantarum]|uniref:hydroxyacid dehydrogenase n=1 Tax=Paenibacillus plantarum TaxID=2654975 RepID=UPI0014926B2C|nr:hydroxyacid dehydrogenase [Paenibacillus plantarum]
MTRKIVVQIQRNELSAFLEPDAWEKLQQLGELVVNPFDRPFTAEELESHLEDASACISTWGSSSITKEMLESATKLELVAHMAGSVKHVIAAEAFDRGITVLSGGHAIAQSVAESIVALILAVGHRIKLVDESMRGNVSWKSPAMEADELRGKTVGFIALGMVAQEVIRLLQPFQVKFIAYDPYMKSEKAAALGVELLPLHDVLTRAQIVSLHLPMIPETDHMIGREELRLLQDDCLLINTSRGSVIHEEALIGELRTNRFFAALDVFEQEPLPLGSELRRLPNVLVRPHIAGVNPSSRMRIGRALVEDMHRYFNGEPIEHGVSKARLALMT